jgi:hypothetical protein
VGDLPPPVGEIDRHHHRSEADDRQVGDDEFRPIAEKEGHAIPLPQAQGREAGGQRVRRREQAAIGEDGLLLGPFGNLAEAQSGFLRRAPQGNGEEIQDVHGRMLRCFSR